MAEVLKTSDQIIGELHEKYGPGAPLLGVAVGEAGDRLTRAGLIREEDGPAILRGIADAFEAIVHERRAAQAAQLNEQGVR